MLKTFSWCFKLEIMKENAKKKHVTAMKDEGIVWQWTTFILLPLDAFTASSSNFTAT